jgi:NAD(P)-dependent dehydrogenase (short-subunit alcohol dehydrogenase family)
MMNYALGAYGPIADERGHSVMSADGGSQRRLEGKVCLVTGATSGIGYVTARELARAGATVWLVGRDEGRCAAAVQRICSETGATVERVRSEVADLSSQEAIHRLVERLTSLSRLDVLVNNAGAMFDERVTTVDGYEKTFALNHLAYFSLTNLLIDKLQAGAPARVVNVASDAHRNVKGIDFDDPQLTRRYSSWKAYCQSKLANVMFTNELARRLEGRGVTTNSLHPGFVRSNFFTKPGFRWWIIRQVAGAFATDPEEGAKTPLHLAASDEADGITGHYFVKCKSVEPSAAALDVEAARRLWDLSARLTGIDGA